MYKCLDCNATLMSKYDAYEKHHLVCPKKIDDCSDETSSEEASLPESDGQVNTRSSSSDDDDSNNSHNSGSSSSSNNGTGDDSNDSNMNRTSSSGSSMDDSNSGNGQRRTSSWYAARLAAPLCAGSNSSTFDVNCFLLQWKNRFTVQDEAVSSLLGWMNSVLPAGNLLPPTLALMRGSMGVHPSSHLQIHVCSRKGCSGYLFPYVAKEKYSEHLQDACPICNYPRFQVLQNGGREVIEPVSWYIDMRAEEVTPNYCH